MGLPRAEVAVWILMSAEFGIDFFVNIDEAGWNGGVPINRKSEAVCDAWGMIGVLAEDDNADGG